ncbi:MAG TPA: TIGR02186 family protein [Rhizomicrobium sp.]|nr:TIGR02186 family protein [Rhizomicrobium sp.]
MGGGKRRAALFAASLFFSAGAAQADDLVAGLSQDIIQITSNYNGTDIVAFGAIENMNVMTAAGPLDIVVAVRGPNADITVRKKERVAGIWLNNHGVVMRGIPGYYYVASTRPLSAIAPEDTLKRYELGLDLVEPSSTTARTPEIAEPYRQALVRHKLIEGLYNENAGGVEFLSPTLFRARVPVPADVPRGQYNVQVYLFRDGNVVSAQSTPLYVDQTGLERRLFNFAHQEPLAYGLSTVLMAAALGWLSSIVFRRMT